jgi:ADP-ribosylglycohydrolase
MQEELAKDVAPVVYSALWAAYGDAVGFISEGTDAKGLKRRLGGGRLGTVKWKRKLGRIGPEMTLPAGCYSDDTQLRLATSRAIRADGSFGVDLFSNIEVPLFLAYSLGAGLGTTSSARRLLSGTRWHDLVRGANAAKYVKGGGNGGAMRIQPHVWAAGQKSEDWRAAIVENVLTTHGHPTALVGALFHAEVLRATALTGGPLTTDEGADVLHAVRGSIGIIDKHPKLGPPWVFGWERESGRSFQAEYDDACRDVLEGLASLDAALQRTDREAAYHDLLGALGAFTDGQRGSGTKTALAAFGATLLFSERPPADLMRAVAEELGSDTDTIATMAGALVGLYAHEEPAAILDRSYIVGEAARLARIALGDRNAGEFRYRRDGDVRLPKDGRVLHQHEGVTYVAGLGRAEPAREPARKGTNGELYRWYHLEIGQSMLFHVPPGKAEDVTERSPARRADAEPSLFDDGRTERDVPRRRTGPPPQPPEPLRRRTVVLEDPRDVAMALMREGIDDPARVGRFFLARARHEGNEAWVGSVFYELARLYRIGLRNAAAIAHIAADRAPEPPRPAHPVLNLQLTASRGTNGSVVDGIIGNYGRNAATEIAVRLSGNGSAPDLMYKALQVQEINEVAARTLRPIDDGTTVTVTFCAPDGTQLRQEGRFERAPGHEATFLLKGLSVARPVTA